MSVSDEHWLPTFLWEREREMRASTSDSLLLTFSLYFSVHLVPVGRPHERGHTWGWPGRGESAHRWEVRGGEGGPGGPGHRHQGDHLPDKQVSLAALPDHLGFHPLQPGGLLHKPRLRPPGVPAERLPPPPTRELWGHQTLQLHRDLHQVRQRRAERGQSRVTNLLLDNIAF